MVESEVFFEPYHRVLKVLQNSRSENLSMKKYIVEVQVRISFILLHAMHIFYFGTILKVTQTMEKGRNTLDIFMLNMWMWPLQCHQFISEVAKSETRPQCGSKSPIKIRRRRPVKIPTSFYGISAV